MDRGASWDIIRDCKESDAAEHTHNYKVLGFLQLEKLFILLLYISFQEPWFRVKTP